MSDISTFFEEHGYYHAKGVFNKNALAKLEQDFDHVVRQLTESGEQVNAKWEGAATAKLSNSADKVLHTHNVQKYSRNWLNALLDEAFLETPKNILGDDIILHHSKLFQKPAEEGAPFPMHQDWPYFPSVNDSMMAGIIHVSDATDEMGCLRVYPGSHKLGRIPNSDGKSECPELENYPIENAKIIEAEAGDVVFFHYLTLHGSMPNRSNKTRKTVLCQMYRGDDQIEADNMHPNERLVLSGWNYNMSRNIAAMAA